MDSTAFPFSINSVRFYPEGSSWHLSLDWTIAQWWSVSVLQQARSVADVLSDVEAWITNNCPLSVLALVLLTQGGNLSPSLMCRSALPRPKVHLVWSWKQPQWCSLKNHTSMSSSQPGTSSSPHCVKSHVLFLSILFLFCLPWCLRYLKFLQVLRKALVLGDVVPAVTLNLLLFHFQLPLEESSLWGNNT